MSDEGGGVGGGGGGGEEGEEEEKQKYYFASLSKMKSYESRYIIKESKHLIIILHLIIQYI